MRRYVQPVLDVVADLFLAERFQPAAPRHPLIELAHLRRSKHVLQIRLPDEHDLEKLGLVGFEI